MLDKFSDTLQKTSKDRNNKEYMTFCQQDVVNVDSLKNYLTKELSLPEEPKSCDALYLTPEKELFLIEFKNGKLIDEKNHDLNEKIFESLLIVSEKISETIGFMRENISFILVYNKNKLHRKIQKGNENTGVRRVDNHIFRKAHDHLIRFELRRFKKLYFKDVFTYSTEEFESEFVSRYCV
jgi:hypothetical protein